MLSDGTTGVGSNALHGDRDPAQASKENARKLGTPEQEMANANNDEGEGNWKREYVVFFDLHLIRSPKLRRRHCLPICQPPRSHRDHVTIKWFIFK